jgi:hypothetical protein
LYRCEDADPEADPSPPPPRPRSAWPPLCSAPPPPRAPPPAAVAPAPPPTWSPILHRQRCPPFPAPAASCSPPEKMRCKEVNNFILEKWYENENATLPLCEWVDEPTNDGMKMKRLPVSVDWQYYNLEKGCPSTTPCYYSFLQRAFA